ncbi:hypothetical protein AADZ86_17830 [Colwelliaceae bacterium BS250]
MDTAILKPLYKSCGLAFISLVLVSSCTSTDLYPITDSHAKINEMQILDPMAAENNAGIVNDLDGVYGEKVITSYQEASSSPEDGRTGEVASTAMGSGG